MSVVFVTKHASNSRMSKHVFPILLMKILSKLKVYILQAVSIPNATI